MLKDPHHNVVRLNALGNGFLSILRVNRLSCGVQAMYVDDALQLIIA